MLAIAQIVALTGLVIAAFGLAARWREIVRRPAPPDLAPPKGSPQQGVLYAFTLGMAPWAKESTQLHTRAYLRGVAFHLAVLVGAFVVVAYAQVGRLPEMLRDGLALWLGAGAVLSAAGSVIRLRHPGLSVLSTADDHLAIWLVTAFLGATAAAVVTPHFAVPMYLVAGVLLAYIPLGKIRHCMYFFFSRRAFGRFVGRRGVLPHPTTSPQAVR